MPKRKAVDRPPPRGREEVCQALIEAGTRLFAKHGPDAVSVRDLAAEARVNHSLVFRHFGNKDALVRAIFESMFENSGPKDQNITSARDRLQASVAALTTNKDLWRLLTYAMLEGKTPVLLSIPSRYMKETLDRFQAEQEDGVLRSDIDARLMIAAGMALGLGWQVFQPLIASLAQLSKEDQSNIQHKLMDLWKIRITSKE
jgi:AcrR family transcriptional regulator